MQAEERGRPPEVGEEVDGEDGESDAGTALRSRRIESPPHQPDGDSHEREQRRPHRAEHPVRRRERRALEGAVPRLEALRGEDGARGTDEFDDEDGEDEREAGTLVGQTVGSLAEGHTLRYGRRGQRRTVDESPLYVRFRQQVFERLVVQPVTELAELIGRRLEQVFALLRRRVGLVAEDAVARVVGGVVEGARAVFDGLGGLDVRHAAVAGRRQLVVADEVVVEVLDHRRLLRAAVGAVLGEEVVDEFGDALVPHPLDVDVKF